MIVYQEQQGDNLVHLALLGWHTLYDVYLWHSRSLIHGKRFISKIDLYCYEYQASNDIVLAIRSIL